MGAIKSFSISTLNLQNWSIFMAKCGKFLYFCGKMFRFLWQNLGFQMAIFHDASMASALAKLFGICHCQRDIWTFAIFFVCFKDSKK